MGFINGLRKLVEQGTGSALVTIGLFMMIGSGTGAFDAQTTSANYLATLVSALILVAIGAGMNLFQWHRNQVVFEAVKEAELRERALTAEANAEIRRVALETANADLQRLGQQPVRVEPIKPA